MKFFKTKKGIIITSVLCLLAFLIIRRMYNASAAFYVPEYEQTDVSGIIRKEELSASDYTLIYEQTGVSPLAAKKIIESGSYQTLEELNKLYFKKPSFKKNYIAYPITAEERNELQNTPLADIKKGDILVTFNTHTFDWRHGHCALVLDADKGILLEHMAIGQTSCTTDISYWGTYPAFAILRYPDEEIAANAADYAKEHLLDIGYNFLAGIITKDKSDEDMLSGSHCSHIVWQAYRTQGVDIDQNGGPIVTPKDISRSEKLNVVQIYGLNPDDYTSRILTMEK